ncbi:MAG: hypothetical protein H6832_08610 [Planctomycetes bacterium]|nr:hypothetical protein [Planctomycetota bacterium]MCB9918451.1 hypothetical protein [Planctomycetota bacterium]
MPNDWTPRSVATWSVLVSCACSFPIGNVRAQLRHVAPSELADRVGQDLPRVTTLEDALERAQAEGRRVLWYIKTVPRSPMDRKNIVDLYVRAGYFSDPDLRPELARFVVLDRVPSREEARRFDLAPFRFVEPGFLVLDAQGNELARAHALTTFSPTWFVGLLERFAGTSKDVPVDVAGTDVLPAAAALRSARLHGRWTELASLRQTIDKTSVTLDPELACQVALAHLAASGNSALGDAARGDTDPRSETVGMAEGALQRASTKTARTRFLSACIAARSGRAELAKKLWRELASGSEDAIFGPRAAAEAEGFGPVGRGFWSYRSLPFDAATTFAAPDAKDAGRVWTTTVRTSEAALGTLRARSVDYLLAMQTEHGGFEDSNYDFGGLDSLPNVYVAVTALCTEALIRELAATPDHPRRSAIDRAIRLGIRYCFDDARINPEDLDEWVWARVYPLELVATLLDELDRETEAEQIYGMSRERLQAQLEHWTRELWSRQENDGSFRHEYANPFVTATVLHALAIAKRHGVELPEPELLRALASLEACRSKLGAYSYGQTRVGRSVRAGVAEAAGRMPLCESALLAFERSDPSTLEAALRAAFEHHDQLESTRKYDDHANRLRYGGFFFWFDVRARARALASSTATEAATWRKQLRDLILAIPEFDGVFVDSHELGRCYGTAMALLSLRHR